MKGLIVQLWPKEAMPGSHFGLVRRLVDAFPRLEVVKRSVCIEGARRAFARVKLQWVKLDAVKLIKEGPPEGKELRHPRCTTRVFCRVAVLSRMSVHKM